jgi:hypothetical protein
METVLLHHPTVAELIASLSKLPQDRKIIISDADTQWDIDIIHIDDQDGYIELSGEYPEMNTYKKKV